MHRLCVRLLANIEETLSSPVFSQLVDRLGDTLDLLLGGDPVSIVKNETPLFHFCVFGLRDRGDELGPSPMLNDRLGRLSRRVKLLMPPRILIGGVEDWLIKKLLGHWNSTH